MGIPRGLFYRPEPPLPLEVTGVASFGYINAHSDTLATFCQAVNVQPAPDTQSAQVTVDIPAFLPTAPSGGSGGSGR